ALDNAVRRILRQRERFSLLEGSRPAAAPLDQIKAEDAAVAQAIAEAGAVLLKNAGDTLPLTERDLAGNGVMIAGPGATIAFITGGGSSKVKPLEGMLTPLQALAAYAVPGA